MPIAVTQPVAADAAWYQLTGEEAAARLGVEPATGLSAQRAQDLLAQHGPNELPAEEQTPGWLWIHFVFSAPFGIALGLDQETPGLMRLRPRGGGWSIMSRSLLTTAGLVGLYMAIVLDLLIAFGKSHFGSYAVGSSIGLTAFALMIVVAYYQVRSARGPTLVSETFDNRTLNITALAEVFLALLVTQMDAFHRLLGTVDLTGPQFLLALAAAALLFVLWELGKLVTRRR